MLLGAVVGASMAVTGGAVAGYRLLNPEPQFAEVVAVTPLTKEVTTPRKVCSEKLVTRQRAPKDERRVTGTVVGAVVGGVLGNQIGGGNGKKLATVAGAAAGGYAGNRIQRNIQQRDTYTTTQRSCKTVYDKKLENEGYQVRYRIKEKTGVVRMDYDPGQMIPLRDGQLVVNEPPQAKAAPKKG
jgi:uncharacterized protein YcfJ